MQLPAKIGPAVRILRDSLIVTHRKLVVSVKAPLAVWVAQGNDRFHREDSLDNAPQALINPADHEERRAHVTVDFYHVCKRDDSCHGPVRTKDKDKFPQRPLRAVGVLEGLGTWGAADGCSRRSLLWSAMPGPAGQRRGEPELGVECAVVAAGQPVGRCGHYRAAPVDEDMVDGEQGRAPAGLRSPGKG